MKKIIISLVMVLILMFNIVSVNAASVQNKYPESEHNYKSNSWDQWSYTYNDNADCLFVTFSEDTYFGPGGKDYFDEKTCEYSCDYLIIYSENINFCEYYFADELAGKTIVIPGSKIYLILISDESKNYYGFKITNVSAQGDLGDKVCVTYRIDENNKWSDIYTLNDDGSFPVTNELKNKIFNDKAVIGWKDDCGHEYIYNNNSEIVLDEEGYYEIESDKQFTNVFGLKPGNRITLAPVYTTVSISTDETFSFYNSGMIFRNGYKMTNAHSKQLRKCYQSATRNNQFGILGVPLGLLLPPIYQMVPFAGSCCGFPIATIMQHYGMIDLLSGEDVSSVRELKPTKNVLSAINFYNAVTPAAIVCANKAPEPRTEEYKAQIKNLFETVSSGKPAVCFIHCGYIDGVSYKNVFSIMTGILSKGIKYMIDSFADTHCILLTGAYTDGDGNRIFIGYDENYASYCYGEPQIYKISGDYEDVIEAESFDDSLGAIAWLSDVSCLESFKADGETDPSAWYSYFRENKEVN